ncbi:hypothetical protein ISF_05042 [Cordyceps fumosorosea ARSEF 2679]|uniref:Uncharacterized protein n=1 Tax=Cordyceps fumosorosea (strain ARSEF 2679) TaxID=1081104 RepID=A0A167W032_CORFA|nr:hypothetical protein ISF_05042 [Cordyceps fumosorosea ARSEF 2679]OAA63166.1 hypothetical protein ISF_05042 [Cordyceps fumosorosea ARSEF 2679]
MLFSFIVNAVLAGCTWRPEHVKSAGTSTSTSTGNSDRLQPTLESSRSRAHPIFRAINNAGRQWGSAMNHNGFGFFPAIIPAGTVLYHGTRSKEAPKTFEWLAFEIEHAEAFALDVDFPVTNHGIENADERLSMKHAHGAQKILDRRGHEADAGKLGDGGPPRRLPPGYIQSHQATKDLHVLYLDGMSAAKTDLGTMDAELYVLYGKPNKNFEDGEFTRARALCPMLAKWGFDGYVRMEIGFEYVHCDFSKDVDWISSVALYNHKGVVSDSSMVFFQWARAVAENYDGVGADRLRIDYSSMVSGLFYPINITTMDPDRPDLMRLATAGMDECQKLKPEVELMARQPRRFTVNWQAVTDTIVRRFSNRLALMASEGISEAYLIDEFETASRTYVIAPEPKDSKAPLAPGLLQEAISRCIEQPLLPATFKKSQWSREDTLIAAALEVVIKDICSVILQSYNALRAATEKDVSGESSERADASATHVRKAAKRAHQDIKDLVATLNWSQWKQVPRCPSGEMMFTIMWPLGNTEDYFNPACQPIEKINMYRQTYFRDTFPGGHGPRRGHGSEIEA